MAAKLINAGILANIIEGVDKCVLSPNTFLNWRCLMHMHMQFRQIISLHVFGPLTKDIDAKSLNDIFTVTICRSG